MSLTVKAYLTRVGQQEPEVRRFAIDADVSTNYNYFIDKVAQVFPGLYQKNFTVGWKDSDNDLILFSSDEELTDALGYVTDGVFKIYIQQVSDHSTNGPTPRPFGPFHNHGNQGFIPGFGPQGFIPGFGPHGPGPHGPAPHGLGPHSSGHQGFMPGFGPHGPHGPGFMPGSGPQGFRPFPGPQGPGPHGAGPQGPGPQGPGPQGPVPQGPGPQGFGAGWRGGVRHPGVVCDSCDGPVLGVRYKCEVCPDYDLCEGCKSTGLHSEHNMKTIETPTNGSASFSFGGAGAAPGGIFQCMFGAPPMMNLPPPPPNFWGGMDPAARRAWRHWMKAAFRADKEARKSEKRAEKRGKHEEKKMKKRNKKSKTWRMDTDETKESAAAATGAAAAGTSDLPPGTSKEDDKKKRDVTSSSSDSSSSSEASDVEGEREGVAPPGTSPSESYLQSVGKSVAAMLRPLGIDVEVDVEHRGRTSRCGGERSGWGAEAWCPWGASGAGFNWGFNPQPPTNSGSQAPTGAKATTSSTQASSNGSQAPTSGSQAPTVSQAPTASAVGGSEVRQSDGVCRETGEPVVKGSNADPTASRSSPVGVGSDWMIVGEHGGVEGATRGVANLSVSADSQQLQQGGSTAAAAAASAPSAPSGARAESVRSSVEQMRSMGFNDDDGWLTNLLTANGGDVSAALDFISLNNMYQNNSSSNK